VNTNILIILGSQTLFAISSLIARSATKDQTFTARYVLTSWFITFILIRLVATLLELYVLTRVNLGQTVALAGVCGLITANLIGVVFLKEVLTPLNYLGIGFAIIAILLLSHK